MTDFEAMTELVEAQIKSTVDEMDALEVGSEERSRAAKDLASLYNVRLEAEKARQNEEDQSERRNEIKRMNDKEIEFKEGQLENDRIRTENDANSKKAMLKKDLADIGLRFLTNLGMSVEYERMYGRAYAAERDGYMQPRQQLTRPADNVLKLIK